MNKSLLALAIGGLAIGMTEFSMMGLLTDFSKDLQITIPEGGHFISTYALGVVIGAPILVMLSTKYPPKKVLMALMLLFTTFHALFVLAPEYNTLLLTRFLSGLPHGAFFGVGSVVASQLAKTGKEAQAIAIMFTGLTVANLIGVPISTYIGQHYSWRIAYGIICILGIITFAAVYFWIPNIPAQTDNDMKKQLAFFKTKKAWLLVIMISIGTGGLFAWISYISPMMLQVAQLSKPEIPIIMTLVGLGMVLGNLLGGKIADTFSPTKAVIISFTGMSISLIIVYFTVHIPSMAYIMSFVTGLIAFTIGPSLQMMLIRNAKGSEMLAASAGQASFNVGNALGAFLGGLPIAYGFASNSPQWVGAGMALSGALLAFLFLMMQKSAIKQNKQF